MREGKALHRKQRLFRFSLEFDLWIRHYQRQTSRTTVIMENGAASTDVFPHLPEVQESPFLTDHIPLEALTKQSAFTSLSSQSSDQLCVYSNSKKATSFVALLCVVCFIATQRADLTGTY